MTTAAAVACTNYVVLLAEWGVQLAREVLAADPAPLVVVVRHEGRDTYYYVREHGELDALLGPLDGEMPLKVALDLHEYQAEPVLVPSSPAGERDGVVLDAEGLVGPSGPRWSQWGPTPTGAEPPLGERGTEVARTARADLAERLAVGVESPLRVVFKQEVAPTGPTVVAFRAATGASLRVQVLCSSNLAIPDADRSLVLEDGEQTLTFAVTPTAAGQASVTVLLSMGTQVLGSLTMLPVVDAQPAEAVSPSAAVDATLTSPADFEPDVLLTILEPVPGELVISARSTRDHDLDFTAPAVTLERPPEAYLGQLYDAIAAIDPEAPDANEKGEVALGALGGVLWGELVPAGLQPLLWKLRDSISSIAVFSNQPSIPWELARMCGDDGTGTVVDGPFLCEQYAITRWRPQVPSQQTLSFAKLAVIAPAGTALAWREEEVDRLHDLEDLGCEVVDVVPRPAEVLAAMASGTFTALHFTGHAVEEGEVDRAAIVLEGGLALRPENLAGGSVTNLRKRRPLVVFNGCETGRAGKGLTRSGGWPDRFLQAGAGAFVGTLWPVVDESAALFQETFYERLIEGDSIGEAAKAARRAVKDTGSTSWLAYTVFAHPLARVW